MRFWLFLFLDRFSSASSYLLVSVAKKLHNFYTHSRWRKIGNPNLYHNLSRTKLSITMLEALCLGLKFATEIRKETLTTITKSYRFDHTD